MPTSTKLPGLMLLLSSATLLAAGAGRAEDVGAVMAALKDRAAERRYLTGLCQRRQYWRDQRILLDPQVEAATRELQATNRPLPPGGVHRWDLDRMRKDSEEDYEIIRRRVRAEAARRGTCARSNPTRHRRADRRRLGECR